MQALGVHHPTSLYKFKPFIGRTAHLTRLIPANDISLSTSQAVANESWWTRLMDYPQGN